jgi:amidase
VSNLFGRTVNPRNTNMSTGGSSGGEAALIACRGSLLGVGTDSGGSIRIPAAFNGLYGLKTTSTRLSCKGNKNITPSLGIASCIGPIARSVRDLQLLMRVLLAGEPWLRDSAVVETPWVNIKEDGPFNIGVVVWDETVMPHPPIVRATRISMQKIAAAGHQGRAIQSRFKEDLLTNTQS